MASRRISSVKAFDTYTTADLGDKVSQSNFFMMCQKSMSKLNMYIIIN